LIGNKICASLIKNNCYRLQLLEFRPVSGDYYRNIDNIFLPSIWRWPWCSWGRHWK